MYLVMGCLLTMAQLGIILSLFFNLNGVVANIALYKLSIEPLLGWVSEACCIRWVCIETVPVTFEVGLVVDCPLTRGLLAGWVGLRQMGDPGPDHQTCMIPKANSECRRCCAHAKFVLLPTPCTDPLDAKVLHQQDVPIGHAHLAPSHSELPLSSVPSPPPTHVD